MLGGLRFSQLVVRSRETQMTDVDGVISNAYLPEWKSGGWKLNNADFSICLCLMLFEDVCAL